MTPERCPHCQQRMPKQRVTPMPSRICRKCKSPIASHHKYKVETDGEASWFEHRHCDFPESYDGKPFQWSRQLKDQSVLTKGEE